MDGKRFIRNILNIPTALTIILIIFSAASLIIIFMKGYDKSPLSPIFYTVSAYTLTVICYKAARNIAPVKAKVKEKRIVKDNALRQKYMLLLTAVTTGSYIILKSMIGILFHIPWLIALAFYYIIMLTIRLLLIKKEQKSRNLPYAIAVMLILIAVSIALITIDMVRGRYKFHYPGYLIYVFALYSFISIFTSIRGFIRERRNSDISIRCYRTVTLASASVSLVVLQSAMFSSFGAPDDSSSERTMYITLSFSVVAIIVLLALFLIKSNKKPAP